MGFFGFGDDKPAYLTVIFAFDSPENYSSISKLQEFIDSKPELKGNFFGDKLGLQVRKTFIINIPKKVANGKDERGLTQYFDYVLPENIELKKLVGAVLRVYDPGWGDIGDHWDDYVQAKSILESLNETLIVYKTDGTIFDNKKKIFNDLVTKKIIEKSAIYFDEKELEAYKKKQQEKQEEETNNQINQQVTDAINKLLQQLQTETDQSKIEAIQNKIDELKNLYTFKTNNTDNTIKPKTAENTFNFLNNPMVLMGIGLFLIIILFALKK